MFTSVAGRSVIVTGGSKGIGRGISRAFVRAGANVLITGRSEDALRQTAHELGGFPGTISWVTADVSSRADCEHMAAVAAERNGGIDVLCANAGIFPAAALSTMAQDQLDLVLDTNVKGTIWSVQACIPELARTGHGRVILTSSITGPITGYPGWSHYGASKAAQLGFMRTAAMELAPDHITVNAVLPGNVVTEGLDGMGQDYLDQMAASVPLGKLGSVDDIANAALFLATDEAAYITGQAIVIDGGQTLPESLAALNEA